MFELTFLLSFATCVWFIFRAHKTGRNPRIWGFVGLMIGMGMGIVLFTKPEINPGLAIPFLLLAFGIAIVIGSKCMPVTKVTDKTHHQCPECGMEISIDVSFCPQCGVRIQSAIGKSPRPHSSSVWQLRKLRWLLLTLPGALIGFYFLGYLYNIQLEIPIESGSWVVLITATALLLLICAVLPFLVRASARAWFVLGLCVIAAISVELAVRSLDPPRLLQIDGPQSVFFHAKRLGVREDMLGAADGSAIVLVVVAVFLFFLGKQYRKSEIEKND